MLSITVSKINLKPLKKQVKRTIDQLPKKLGATAVRYVSDNFRKQGFDNKGITRWDRRAGRKRAGRAILIKSGRLRRDIRVRRITKKYVVVGTSGNVKYAAIHNTGGTINHPGGTPFFTNKSGDTIFVNRVSAQTYEAKTGRKMRRTKKHKIKIPRRQYMPTKRRPSATLNKRLKNTVRTELKKIK